MRRTVVTFGVAVLLGAGAGCDGGGGSSSIDPVTGPDADPPDVGVGVDVEEELPPPPVPEPKLGDQLDRAGRDGINMALTDPWGLREIYSHQNRDMYNRASDRSSWATLFRDRFEFSISIWDGIDGVCGNQLGAGPSAVPGRYSVLASLFLDDVLLLDTSFATCNEYLAVEQRILGAANQADCGGRNPLMNAKDAFMTFLMMGTSGRNADGTWKVSDGILEDKDGRPLLTEFPFLLPPGIGTPGTSTGGIDPMQAYLTCAGLGEARCARVYDCWGRNGIPDAYRDAYAWESPECARRMLAECRGTATTSFGPTCPSGQTLDPLLLRGCERAYSLATCDQVMSAGAGLLSDCASNMCM